jgi:hypothetical protein
MIRLEKKRSGLAVPGFILGLFYPILRGEVVDFNRVEK